MAILYKTPPRDFIFDELKNEAIRAWYSMSDLKNLAQWKISVIEGIENVGDGFMYIFDHCCNTHVQEVALDFSSEETRKAVYDRRNSLMQTPNFK